MLQMKGKVLARDFVARDQLYISYRFGVETAKGDLLQNKWLN